MANIFRSDEVYKKPPKDLHNKDEIIPVRGLYITGQYRPPYYADPVINITAFTSNNASIFPLTTAESGTTDSAVNILNIDVVPVFDVENYSVASSETADATVNILNIDVDNSLPDIEFYHTASESTTDAVVNILNIDATFTHDITSLTSVTYKQNPEPILVMTGMTSNRASVDNI